MIKLEEVKDIKKLSILASEIWHEYWPERISAEQTNYMVEKFQSEKAIAEQIKNEKYNYFYIICDGDIAGYTGLSRKENYLFLSKIYIKKNYRNKGIGTKTFEFIKNYAETLGYKKIVLTVKKDNINSINAYKKWNFRISDAVVTDIGNGFVMDDYIMEYDL